MSRTDPSDFDYPPGLSISRHRLHEQEQSIGIPVTNIGSASQQDRRQSNGLTLYSYLNGTGRSWVPPEQRDHSCEFSGPNRHNPSASLGHILSPSLFNTFNNHNHRPSPSPHHPANFHNASGVIYPSSSPSSSPNDRDGIYLRQAQAPIQLHSSQNSLASRSTIWWGDLEPWMDEEYAKQVCNLMGWDPVSIKVPHPAPDASTGQQANNPGYCFLTFPSPAHAASVLTQISSSVNGAPVPMPNSAKPFVMNWASSVGPTSSVYTPFPATNGAQATGVHQYPKEYSIFVGDLAPETSNSDLVAVFRNPVLGLRNDREPKFIRPFLSCKSAKIMLDPLTGVSRGYGFVRFTDEADQQRALIEMHGLYCLSRPMRISPATAKFKAPSLPTFDLPQVQFTPIVAAGNSERSNQSVTIAVPLPTTAQTKSVSVPIAAAGSNPSLAGSNYESSMGDSNSNSSNSLSSGSGTGSSASISTSECGSLSRESIMNLPNNILAQLAQQYASETHPHKLASGGPYAHDAQLRQILAQQNEEAAPRYIVSEESWKHHAQARAILGNLIGPNGEQLTSTDPYNTTVFVGGLSPLISEDTLRTFFAPFGDIHYVKVPVGKHCGFVQFVRKGDAEKAIEKMQGFPIGGSRIRLSWGRSQYKAAQAAAQAAQAAALSEQLLKTKKEEISSGMSSFQPRSEMHRPPLASNFSPFSPDPNNLYTSLESARRESGNSFSHLESLPHPSKAYAPGFHPLPSQELKLNTTLGGSQGKVSPTTASGRPPSATRYGFSETIDPPHNRAPGRVEGPISRPSSGQTSEIQEAGLMHDLNGTLASLELDHSWKSPEAALPRINSY